MLATAWTRVVRIKHTAILGTLLVFMPKIFFLAGDTLDTGVSPGGTYPPAPAFQGGTKII